MEREYHYHTYTYPITQDRKNWNKNAGLLQLLKENVFSRSPEKNTIKAHGMIINMLL